MDFMSAVALAEKATKLIGTDKLPKEVDEILVVPNDEKMYDNFMTNYLHCFDAQQCIIPYMGMDVCVIAFSRRLFHQNGVIFQDIIKPEMFED